MSVWTGSQLLKEFMARFSSFFFSLLNRLTIPNLSPLLNLWDIDDEGALSKLVLFLKLFATNFQVYRFLCSQRTVLLQTVFSDIFGIQSLVLLHLSVGLKYNTVLVFNLFGGLVLNLFTVQCKTKLYWSSWLKTRWCV